MKGGISLARVSTKTNPHKYGEGGICIKDIRGKKKYQYTYFLDGKKYRRYFKCDDDGLKEARAFRDQVVQDKKDGIKGTSDSLYEMIKKYLLSKKKKLTEATKKRYVNTLFVLYRYNEKLLNRQFDTISALDIETALLNVEDKVSSNEGQKAFNLLNATFRTAKKKKLIRENPCEALEEHPTSDTPEQTIFTNDEIVRIFSAVRYMKKSPKYNLTSQPYFDILLALFSTGMRLNELFACKWSDITSLDDEFPHIHVQRTVDSHHTGGGQVTKKPKTRAGNRFIPLPSRLVRRLKKMQPKNATGFIFPTKSGTAIDCHNFYRTWHTILRATARECPSCHTKRPTSWKCSCGHLVTHNAIKCSKCQQKRPISWTCPTCGTMVTEVAHKTHEIRHNYASVLANKYDYPDTVIAGWLGHKSVSVLQNTYMHKPPNYGNLLDGVFNKKRKPKKT